MAGSFFHSRLSSQRNFKLFLCLFVSYFYANRLFFGCFSILLDMKTGKIIARLRDQKGWSQNDLATKAGVSHVMIGKYERGEATPSLEVAKKIADVLDVTLDYLVGEGVNANLDKQNLKRLEELQLLDESKQKVLYDLIDTYIRDAKARQAYAS